MPKKLWSDPYIDFFFVWLFRYWDFHHDLKFNSGTPYVSIAIGPLRIRRFMKRKQL